MLARCPGNDWSGGRPVVLVLLAILGSGCSKSSPTAPSPTSPGDAAQVTSTLAAAAALVEDGLAQDSSQVSAAPSSASRAVGTVSIQAAIRPFTWWQYVTAETRTWSLAWSDTDATGHPNTCIATLNDHMAGRLVIVPASPSDSTQPGTTRIIKPLDKTLTRKVMLERLPIGAERLWKVVAVSGAFVNTPGATTHIQSLRLQSASGVDTTITDPLGWFSVRHIIQFGTNDSVAVTVTTSRNDDPVFIHRWDWRHRLRNNLDGTYSFKWVTSPWGGWRHFGIQACRTPRSTTTRCPSTCRPGTSPSESPSRP